jgi:hypothetical protein
MLINMTPDNRNKGARENIQVNTFPWQWLEKLFSMWTVLPSERIRRTLNC